MSERPYVRVAYSPAVPVVVCDLCGASEAEELVRRSTRRGAIVRCRSCSLVYQNPRPDIADDWTREYSDEEDRFYNEQYVGEGDAKREAAGSVLSVLEELLPGRGRLLEVGSAAGFYLDAARARGWEVAGIEPHSSLGRWARQHMGLEVFIGTLETAPWPDGHFDAVVLYNTLEHLPSPKEALGRIARLVRPGGLIGVQVPKADSVAFRLLRGRWRHAIPYHFFFFTDSTMGRYFDGAGFDLADARTAPKVFTAGLLADRLWEWRWIPPRVGRPLASLVKRSPLSRKRLRINPRDDLLAHGRRREPEPTSPDPPA